VALIGGSIDKSLMTIGSLLSNLTLIGLSSIVFDFSSTNTSLLSSSNLSIQDLECLFWSYDNLAIVELDLILESSNPYESIYLLPSKV
jgi:hypothetical protein